MRLRERIWRALALLAAQPAVNRAIIRYAQRKPFFHLNGYMRRWWAMPRWLLEPNEHDVLEPRWWPFAIRVHHILRADADPYLHDHPWPWRTIILRGWYEEEDVFGDIHIRLEGETRCAQAETFHRITRVSDGGVWTLFIMGRWSHRWGFMVGNPARKVYYRDYESENDRGALVAEEKAA
jgi:hypothetical protein